jgi:dTDP-glucose 4,6-dehydratase
MTNIKTILVTGGAGFIGSAVIRHLINNTRHAVINVDKLTYAGNRESLISINDNSRYCFEQVDICDGKEVARVFHEHQPDIIMHLAAESHVDRSIDGPGEFIQTNIVGTYNLLEQARIYWTQLEEEKKAGFRFHHISTDEVYGDISHGAHVETDILKPSNPYSAAKASGVMLINAWARTYGVQYIILRPTNNYGIGQYPEKLIPLSVKNLNRGKKINLHDQGTPTRNWLHAKDTANAVMTIIDNGAVNEIYNIAGGFEQSNAETVRKIIKAYFGTDDN